jgi:chitodextrinase
MRFLAFFLFLLGARPALAQTIQAPGNVQVVATSGTTVTVSWDLVTGATGYRVYRGGVQVTQTTNRTFNDTGLTPGTTYSYTVSSVDLIQESSQSSPVTVTTPSTPAVPTGLTAVPTAGGVVLDWNNVSGATGYTIFRNGTEIDTSTASTYTDTDIDPSTTYRYSVSATNAAGDSDESGEVTVTTKGDGSQREATWTREFKRADGNFDDEVTFEEYLVAFPNTLPWTVMRNRFLGTDDNLDEVLTVEEYIEHFAGRTVKRPSKAQTFFLADEDGDDLLDSAEYALTLNRGTKPAQVTKRFDKLDKSDSGLLSQREFGIRYGTEE